MPRRADTQENTNTAEPMEQQVPFEVTITEHNPERGVLATADVKVGNMMTIRKIYRILILLRMGHLGPGHGYGKPMKQQFDQAVEKAYQENVLAPVLDQDEAEEEMEQEESAGMNMGM